MSRKNLRQRSTVKTSLRQTMVAAAAAVSGLVVILLVIFNLFKEEETKASETSLIYKSAQVIQDTSPVLRGARNQMIIGVRLDIAGSGNPVKVGAMVFNAAGTSLPVSKNVSNARLWFTGSSSDFQALTQMGSTVKIVDSKDFTFQVNTEVKAGANYFWLTYDIDPEATVSPGAIDAVCREIRIGAISYRPAIPDPEGKRFIEANIPYFSMGNYAINKLNSWNSKRDGSGIAPRELYSARNSYFIQAGHTMISSNGGNLQTLVVEKGGELKLTSPLRLNMVYVACGGKLIQEAEVNDYFCFNTFILEGGATYIHNNTGMFPGYTCRFSPTSRVDFIKMGKQTLDRPTPVSWGTVCVSPDNVTEFSLNHFNTVKGDLEIKSPAKRLTCTASAGATYTIEGSLILNGATFMGAQGKNTSAMKMFLGRDLIIKTATFTSGIYAPFDLTIAGNVTLNEGSIWLGHPNITCSFAGQGITTWSQTPGSDAALGHVKVAPAHELTVAGTHFAEVAPKCTVEVMSGARFMCNSSILSGEGVFYLADKGTLGIGHADGLFSEGAKGNIQTSGRIFSSGATYVYNGGSTPQSTGIFETVPSKNTVRSLVLQKEKKSQVLTLSQPMSIEDQLRITRGDIRAGSFELRVPQMQVQR